MKNKIIKIIISGFYLGYIPIAPGSFGALLGVILYIFLFRKLNIYIYLIVLFILIIVGVYLTGFGEEIFGIRDSPCIVFDEIVGFLTVATFMKFTSTEPTVGDIILLYFLARLFDATKPPPVKKIAQFKKGFGVILDDVAASIYAGISFILIVLLFTNRI